ncbi:disulfide oxidoreductase [Penicillium waksmanii]|uniref:disulfide oxidoreductase n=1 Tax=Penicillium waksmanii TaxID=69791 RepID=UPI002547692D|nr:disulfide oxidoreductase [Penicillium waksmanii]KAJ6000982.1 disulfide oxidoreductase [Penicillium waksmanii]
MTPKQTIAIIGSGWGGYNLAHTLDTSKYNVVVISPEATSAITPLLASAACGLFYSQLAQEPIRRKHLDVQYVKACVQDIQFKEKTLICQPAFHSLKDEQFKISYDKVVVAPGCSTNTFNTPGVDEHAFMVKNVNDANAIRDKINENLEIASLPCTTENQQRQLLHIAIVGGGPTGIEIAAELTDLFAGDLMKLYPHLRGKASVTVHDVAPNILAPFDQKLSEYAQKSLEKHKVEIKVNSHIINVTNDTIETREDGKIAYGILIWATGNKQRPIVDQLNVMKSNHGLKRILTDDRLQVLALDGTIIPGSYAMGDAADIDGASLPTTAEVAVQKAAYLAHSINAAAVGRTIEPFKYQQRALVTYTGAGDGVIMGRRGHEYTGYGAWLSWRSGNFFWTRSWKRKFMMTLAWIMDWVDGREMARF